MVQKKYEVQLSSQEKGRLRKMIRSGRSSAQGMTRARILLKIAEGLERSPSSRCSGHLRADRVPGQAAVRRGRVG